MQIKADFNDKKLEHFPSEPLKLEGLQTLILDNNLICSIPTDIRSEVSK